MNEEEKESFKFLKDVCKAGFNSRILGSYDLKNILNIIERQQKEIEDLKNDHIDFWINTKEVEDMVRGKFINKDKIKELREIDNIDLIQFKIKELLGE